MNKKKEEQKRSRADHLNLLKNTEVTGAEMSCIKLIASEWFQELFVKVDMLNFYTPGYAAFTGSQN